MQSIFRPAIVKTPSHIVADKYKHTNTQMLNYKYPKINACHANISCKYPSAPTLYTPSHIVAGEYSLQSFLIQSSLRPIKCRNKYKTTSPIMSWMYLSKKSNTSPEIH